MKKGTSVIQSADDFGILSAIWILACNDENPIITFRGIQYRLDLPANYDVVKLVTARGELFRKGVSRSRLSQWKCKMEKGEQLPSWIRDISDEAERRNSISALTEKDVFRSQFRAGLDTHKSEIEVIKWGLEHIERLRKAESEVQEGKIKRISGMWIPILSMLIALAALVTSSLLQNKAISTQVEVKKYEMTFNPKQESYALFMKAIIEAFEAAWLGNPGSLIVKLDQGEIKYFELEQFMNERDRNAILGQFQQFSAMCSELVKEPHQSSRREGFWGSVKFLV